MQTKTLCFPLIALAALTTCSKPVEQPVVAPARPSILFVTLDTTRADAIGPEAGNVETPAFNALAARGMRFRQAYATTPQTLPSHSSMMTGLYPAGHGVHENGRRLQSDLPLIAERVSAVGYRTAAFVSAFALARRFGLARGFDVYDEDFGQNRAERSAKETTDRALAWLNRQDDRPAFLWVHYYDPHYPYTPPGAFRTRYEDHPYHGEVAFMDEQLGRLVAGFEQTARGSRAILVTADHGEGLNEHGEAQHGNLLYQSTMHVPLVVVGPGITPSVNDTPVSLRRIFHTLLDLAGIDAKDSLRGATTEPVVVAEAMKPFLDYGWQPQVMALEGRQKAIVAGRIEVYDVIADPDESDDLSSKAEISRAIRKTLREYPIPSPQAAAPATLDDESRRQLASLGYVGSTAPPAVRKDAPRPADMAHLFPILDKASGLFVREQYKEAIPLLQQIQAADPGNLDAALRLAVSHSSLGQDTEALRAFRKAEAIAPDSPDVRTYLALHYAKGRNWQQAVPLLERIVAEEPDRVPPLEALAGIRERQQRFADALALRQKLLTLKAPSPAELLRVGELAMNVGNTPVAIDAYEKARAAQGAAFAHDLELGVLYLAARRLEDAAAALDRVPPAAPGYSMALFKRAQVSVLLGERDSGARIEAARNRADDTTRPLIDREKLFQVREPSPR